ncbi:MAG: transposase, partial [Chloroflexi bacterium]|nr:transposase [Chloroflexota bacterium]
SRTCPECGLIDKQNRPTQAVFRCVGCGFSGHADAIAAGVIASRAHGDAPDAALVGSAPSGSRRDSCKSALTCVK